jgi:hypothetical protein
MKLRQIVVTVVIFTAVFSTPAHAGLFGKSQCEKVASQIAQQDSIGRSLWNILNDAWKKKKASGTNSDNLSVVLASEDLWNQYAKMIKIGIDNSQCYNSNQVAKMISGRTAALKAAKAAKTWENGNNWAGFWTKNIFDRYYTFNESFLK